MLNQRGHADLCFSVDAAAIALIVAFEAWRTRPQEARRPRRVVPA